MKPPYRFERSISDAPEWRIYARGTGQLICTARDTDLCEAIYRLGREPRSAEKKEGRRLQ